MLFDYKLSIISVNYLNLRYVKKTKKKTKLFLNGNPTEFFSALFVNMKNK